MIDNFVIFTNEISRYIIPLLLVMIPFYGLVFKKIKVYESFVDGAKAGYNIAIRIIPYLVAIIVAIGMFRASDALEIYSLINISLSLYKELATIFSILPTSA